MKFTDFKKNKDKKHAYELHRVNIKYDKLKNLMDVNNYTFDKIIEVIKSFKNIRIHVVGDLIIDTHNECDAVAGLHKSPTLSLIKKNSTIIGDVKCSQVLFDEIENSGGKPIISQTGHSHVKINDLL